MSLANALRSAKELARLIDSPCDFSWPVVVRGTNAHHFRPHKDGQWPGHRPAMPIRHKLHDQWEDGWEGDGNEPDGWESDGHDDPTFSP